MNNTFIIARHGRTEWNLQRRLQGDLESPLLDKSIVQLKDVGNKIISNYKIDLAYCSPKQRCKNSFNIAFPNIQVEYDNNLTEINYGIYEGKLLDEIDVSEMKKDIWNNPWTGGESNKNVYDRVNVFISSLQCVNKNILIMAHEGVNKILIGILCSLSKLEMIKIRQPNHVCYIINNGKIKLIDPYNLDYDNMVFKNIR